MKQISPHCLAAAVFGLSLSYGSTALARTVIVNGVLMGPADIAVLQWIHGDYIPDGSYWLDFNTGAWGYQGGGQEGVIGENNYPGGAQECGQGFQYDCQRDKFCAENPSICSPMR